MLTHLLDRVATAALEYDVILDRHQGLTEVTPGVIIFYGVRRDKRLVSHGKGRQNRYLALLDEHITIELYENNTALRLSP